MELPLPLLGTYFTIQQSIVTVNVGTPVQLMAMDPSRWAWIITLQSSAGGGISTDTDPAHPYIFLMSQAGDRAEMVFRDFGGLVQYPWFGTSFLNPFILGVVEILYRPPQLAPTQE